MFIEVRDKGDKLEIRNQQTKVVVTISYDEEKSYFQNVLSIFSGWGVVNYSSNAHYDFFSLKKLKEETNE